MKDYHINIFYSEKDEGYIADIRLFRTYYAKPAQKPYWARIFLK